MDHGKANSDYIVLNGGDVSKCLKDDYPDLDNKISKAVLGAEKCVIAYLEPNFKGANILLCHTVDLVAPFNG